MTRVSIGLMKDNLESADKLEQQSAMPEAGEVEALVEVQRHGQRVPIIVNQESYFRRSP